MIALEKNSFEPFRIKVGNVQLVCLAIGIKILKHSAYQNLVNQELHMAAMLLMDKDKRENICREDLTDMISGKFGSI